MNQETIKHHSKHLLLAGLVVLALVGFGALGYKIYSDSHTKNSAGNSLGDGPAAPIEKDATGSSKISTNSATSSSSTNNRIKEANDRKAQSTVRSVAAGAEACITMELGKDKVETVVYQSCDSLAELQDGDYLSPSGVFSDVFLLTNTAKTKICVYAPNKAGNGVVSYDTDVGAVSKVGQGKTTCS